MESTLEKENKCKCVVLKGYGGYDKLSVEQWPYAKKPTSNELLVKVKASGVNFADIYTRQGLMRDRKLPFVLGLECAGIVCVVGNDASDFSEGDRVIVHTGQPGLHAEVVLASADDCTKIPADMPWEDAAALAVNYLTAYFCTIVLGNLKEGESILIPSAAGGVGWAATQLAKTIPNVRVVGTASPQKHDAVKANGVDYVIDSQNPDWHSLVREGFPRGVDVALEISSGESLWKTQQLLNNLGRVILIGANSMIGEESLSLWKVLRSWWQTPSIKPLDLIVNSRSVAGFHLTNVKENLPSKYRSAMKHLLELYRAGKIKPRIDSTWPIDKVVEATQRLANRQNIGKVILTME